MKYWIFGGLTKNDEFNEYVKVLAGLGLPDQRDDCGRLGVVDNRDTAELIHKELQKRMPHLPWEILQITDSGEPLPIQKRLAELTKSTAYWAAKALAMTSPFSISREIMDFVPGKRDARKNTWEEQKAEKVKALLESGIDPLAFDALLSNEINRRLKVNFGIAFLAFTFIFTVASYLIVVFNAVRNWGISENAITALIIETPIQFIGLLYIIARNLFPQTEQALAESAQSCKILQNNQQYAPP